MAPSHTHAPQSNPLVSAAAGAAAGLLGAWMMVRFQHALGGTNDSGSHPHRRQNATPNDTDGTIADEPASMKAASRASEAVAGRPLDEGEKEVAGPMVHYAFGAVTGSFYALAAERRPDVSAAAGIPFGVAVWLIADEIGVPLAGLASKPTDYPLERHASALASHLVFGLTVESVRRMLLGRACARGSAANRAERR